jgi:16S rRNA (adenine1518-N6/adenine1519-N6)-dimethyltransferase
MLEERGLAPRKAFGQNFLVDHNLITRLVDASGVGDGDCVLEVGPGTGVLTEALLARGCRVVAAEIDRGLSGLLRERLGGSERFTLVEGDCLDGKHVLSPALECELDRVRAGGEFTLVANLPYGAATPLLMVLMGRHEECRGIFATVQMEVAQRLAAREGTKEYGPLSILARVTCGAEIVARLPPECFWPRPEVTSAMVALRRHEKALHADPARLLGFCQQIFGQRRKQIGTILGRDRVPAGFDPSMRAESMSVERIIALEDVLRASG